MRRVRLFAVSLLLVLVSITSGFAEETIKIGAIFSVSGPAAFLGQPEKLTAIMLQEQINGKGGVLGKKLEIVIYDDESDVNKAGLAADKLLKNDAVVAAVGPTTSGSTFAVEEKFEKANIPLVSCAAAEKIVKPVKSSIFKTPQSDRHAVAVIFNHMKAKKIKKIALITVSDGFGQAGREVLKELAPKMGFDIVADEVYGPKDTDMTAQLTKIKGTTAEAVICWGTNPGPAVIAKDRIRLGLTIPLYMSHGVASNKFIELAGPASEGILLPAGRLIVVDQISGNNKQKAVLTQYIKDYETRFKSPVSAFGGHAWDAIMLIVRSIEAGKSDKPADIRANLEKIKGFVGTGGIFNFSAADHNGLNEKAFEMVVIEKGDWKIASK